MRTAQRLYERGFITYMRTDSVHLSDQAISAPRGMRCTRLYGKEYLPDEPRRYTNKSANAQEAHEAIRPAGAFFQPAEARPASTGASCALYELIWKRTMASQMADARQTGMSRPRIEAGDAIFRATGKRIDFPGFLRAYVEGADDPEAALEDQEVILPHLEDGDTPDLRGARGAVRTRPSRRRATPKRRWSRRWRPTASAGPAPTPASSAPSSSGATAQRQGQALVPTFTAFAVTALLEEHFPHLVDEKFTARMEETLDEISEGKAEWLPYLREFYLGDEGLQAAGAAARKADRPDRRAHRRLLGGLDAMVKIGKFGPYVEVERDGDERAGVDAQGCGAGRPLVQSRWRTSCARRSTGPTALGRHPETGEPIFVLTGQYGPYLQLGEVVDGAPKPKRASLPKGVKPEDATLPHGARPPEPAAHARRASRRRATRCRPGLGRFGPYIVTTRARRGRSTAPSRARTTSSRCTLPRALELLAQPKQSRGRRAARRRSACSATIPTTSSRSACTRGSTAPT